jgi:hypothetical protein
MAMSKLATYVLPAYAPDNGPLTKKQLGALRKDAQKHLPTGKTIAKAVLF